MTNNLSRNINILVLSCVTLLCCVSCGKFGPDRSGSKVITPRVVSRGLKSLATKGITNTTELVNTEGNYFIIDGYLGSGSTEPDSYFIKRKTLSFDGSSWDWTLSEGEEAPEWRDDVYTYFWSFYPADLWFGPESPISMIVPGVDHKIISFTYALPLPASGAVHNDAINQKDILLAFNYERRRMNDDGSYMDGKSQYMDIEFHHALSKIRFDVSGVLGTNRVANITIKNVSNTCQFTANGSIDSEGPSDVLFMGGNSFVFQNYSQDYVPEDFNVDGSQKDKGEKFFFMIPQSLSRPMGETPALSVTFSNGTSSVTKDKSICFDSESKWEPGKFYTYKINYNGDDFDIILSSVMDIDDWDETSDINLDL